ncbi:FAD-dependent oxidoreductase [Nocardioides sp. NPDC004968]|uniref:FAD-dependent oxidoreductase n=1 Tax=Nocardioides sp. NPDC004968 TaxID=3155894 RepID=UPI0033A6A7A7
MSTHPNDVNLGRSAAPGEPSLTPEQFARARAYGDREMVAAGDVLYTPGDRTYDFFLVEDAGIDIVQLAADTRPQHVVYSRGPGDFTGELSMLTGQAVFLQARVTHPGYVVRVGAGQPLRRLLAEQVDIADVLIDAFTRRRHQVQEQAGSVLEIIGQASTLATRALSTYAARLLLPHVILDASGPGAELLARHRLTHEDLPVAIVADKAIPRATPGDVAAAVGLSFDASGQDVDLVVIGAGPAGLAAAVYGASEGLSTIVLDAKGVGGQAAASSRIENYLGFPQGISGDDLTKRALVQALKFGAQLFTPCEVTALETADPDQITAILCDGTPVRSQAAIIATGARYRRLAVPRLRDFEQSGHIRYSATDIDARDCASRPVTVVGGANSAGQAALFLASRGCHVELVVRGDSIRRTMSDYLATRLEAHSRVKIWLNTTVSALHGDESLRGVSLASSSVGRDAHETDEVESAAVFCFIGAEPETSALTNLRRDDHGFLLTGHRASAELPYQTNVHRVFAAGDVRAGSMKRVASAVGEGAGAVASVHQYLANQIGSRR